MEPRILVAFVAGFLCCATSSAESRFGRHVMRLANRDGVAFVKRGENRFPIVERGPVAVSCMTYREGNRYFVEVGIVNWSDTETRLDSVSFRRQGRAAPIVDTRASAADVRARVRGPFVENLPPDARVPWTVFRDPWPIFPIASGDLGQGERAIGRTFLDARRKARRESDFADYLERFAHEAQDSRIPPGETRLFVFTFDDVGRAKAPSEVAVSVAQQNVVFSYKP